MKILSIPYLKDEFVKKHIKKIGFELYELRADYLNDYNDINFEILSEKTILTIRDVKEGGKNYIDDEKRFKIYKKAVNRGTFIDCELDFYKKYSTELSPEKIILSYHGDSGDLSKIDKMLSYRDKVGFVKIALKIDDWSDLEKIAKKILKFDNIIFVSTGETSQVSRLLYKRFCSVATYIGLDNFSTAKNQLTTSQLYFDIDRVTDKTKIGGIVGGKQVLKSRGLSFYNDYFKNAKIDAVYLPFAVSNLKSFFSWFFKTDFYGLSITMPYKTEVGKFVGYDEKPYNLLTAQKTLLNSDREAFEKSKKYLKMDKSETILIYGSGAMAKLAIEVFAGFNLFVKARNEKSLNNLLQKYRIRKYKSQKIDTLINCTPLGLHEDFFINNDDINFKKVIDLPYDTQKDSSLVEFAKSKGIPFVEGNMFWLWQSQMQLREFLKGISQ